MKYNVAIAGATGAVGQEFLDLLQKRNFPIASLKLLASSNSAGKTINWKQQQIVVEELTHESFQSVDIAFFSAGASRSLEFAPSAAKAGALVIDNSSAFRMDSHIPLVVPECNIKDSFSHNGIIANPNCSTIQMVVSLKPILEDFGIERIGVATYQSVSGSGAKSVDELKKQIHQYAQNQKIDSTVYPNQILLNLIPQIDVFLDNDYTKEEMKMVHETRKILHHPELRISATCVRVPVMRCHSEAIQVETTKPINKEMAIKSFQKAKNLIVMDQINEGIYPMPLELEKTEQTYVGRIRKDISVENGITYWCVADQLYKGAALNAIQIVEGMIEAKKL